MSILLPDGSTYAQASGSSRVVLTDIHGRLDVFQRAVDAYPGRLFVILGDVIDRGPDSPGCVALVRKLVEEGRAVYILGNHEKMFLDSFAQPDPDVREQIMTVWISNGGDATLNQYHALDPSGQRMFDDLHFIVRNAQDWFVEGEVLYAHAARPRLEGGQLPEYAQDETHLWSRPADGIYPLPQGLRWSVHGHTPMQHPVIDEELGVAYIDVGPASLAALDTDTMSVFQFRNLEHSRLVTV